MRLESALSPRTPGNQSRRFPPSEKPMGPPSATGAQGRYPGRPREDVTRIIALILVTVFLTYLPHPKEL